MPPFEPSVHLNRRAIELLQHPENYPGLVKREVAGVPLRVWRYPSFEPYRSWAVIEVKQEFFLRRVVWDQRCVQVHDPMIYACESPLESSVFRFLLSELQAIDLHPFSPVSIIGLDGTSHGVEAGSCYLSARLAWWETPPKEWEPLQNWHTRATALFDSLLPSSTADSP